MSHIFICTCPFCFSMKLCQSAISICVSVSSFNPGIKSGTSGITWHIAPESKIQLFYYGLSPKFLLGNSSLSDIRSIDAHIFWSLLFFPLLHFFLRCTITSFIKTYSLSPFIVFFGWLQKFCNQIIFRSASKILWCVISVRLLSESLATRAFSVYFLILLKTIYRMVSTTTKSENFPDKICSLTIFIITWDAVKI